MKLIYYRAKYYRFIIKSNKPLMIYSIGNLSNSFIYLYTENNSNLSLELW